MRKNDFSVGKVNYDALHGKAILEKGVYSIGGTRFGFDIGLVIDSAMNSCFNYNGMIKLNIDKRLIVSTNSVKYIDGNGLEYAYTLRDGYYECDIINNKGLYKTESGYEIVYANYDKEVYNDSGLIQSIVNKSGVTLFTYTYNSSNQITSFKNNQGTGITLEYSNNLVSKVKSTLGETILEFTYGTNLTTIKIGNVTYKVNKTTTFSVETYNSSNVLKEKFVKTASSSLVDVKKYVGTNLVVHEQLSGQFSTAYNNTHCKIIHKNVITNKSMVYVYKSRKLDHHYELFDEMFHTNAGEARYKGDVYLDYTADKMLGVVKEDSHLSTRYSANQTQNGSKLTFNFNTQVKTPAAFLVSFWVEKGNIPANLCDVFVNNTDIDLQIPLTDLDDGWNFICKPIYYDFTSNINNIYIDFGVSTWNTKIKDVKLTAIDKQLFLNKEYVCYNSVDYDIENLSISYTKGDTTNSIINVHSSDVFNLLLHYLRERNLLKYFFVDNNKKLIPFDSVGFVLYASGKEININILDIKIKTKLCFDNEMIETQFKKHASYNDIHSVTSYVNDGERTDLKEVRYDYYGNVIETIENGIKKTNTYTANELPLTEEISSGTFKFRKSHSYDSNSNYNKLLSETLETGDVVSYTYDSKGRILTENGLGDSHAYAYTNGNMSSYNMNNHLINYAYNDVDYLEKVTQSPQKYKITYTDNKVDTIYYYVSDSELYPIVKYEYANNDKEVTKKTYTSATTFNQEKLYYDDYGRFIKKTRGTNETVLITNDYNTPSRVYHLESKVDSGTSLLQKKTVGNTEYNYEYFPQTDKVKEVVVTENGTQKYNVLYNYEYKDENKPLVSNFVLKDYKVGSSPIPAYQELYTYDSSLKNDLLLKATKKRAGATYGDFTYTYDDLNRLSSKKLTVLNKPLNQTYAYKTYTMNGNTYETNLLSKITYTKNNTADKTVDLSYDTKYNISEIKENSVSKNKYTYDTYNRLIREDNKDLNKSIVYTYDDNGNLLTRQKYAYTTGALAAVTSTDTFSYGGKYNQLTSYNGTSTSINYAGEIKKLNGYTLNYSNSRLSGFNKGTLATGTNTYNLTYDNEGRRTAKNYTYFPGKQTAISYTSRINITYTYILDKLYKEERVTTYSDGIVETVTLEYNYINNELVGFIKTQNGVSTTYIYGKNILGDITEIYDTNLNVVGKYVYDAYGNTTITTNTNSIASLNPFRYRGYYFDTELSLYYCNSRYYNPLWCRWISQDDVEYLDPESINGLNLYCYCMNNPVMYSDISGNSPDSIWKTLFGVAVGVGLAVVTVAAIVASGGALLAPVLFGAGIGAGLNLVGQGVSNLFQGKGFFEDINWGNVALGALSGAAFATGVGGIWGAVAIGATSNAGMSALEGNSWANIGFSALVGGVSAFLGFKLGKFISNKLLNINTNLSTGDYLNMAKIDGSRFFSKSIAVLMSKLYTMGPTIVTGVGRGTTKFVGNYIGDWF